MVTSDALVTRQDQSLSVIAVSQVEVEVALTSMFHPKRHKRSAIKPGSRAAVLRRSEGHVLRPPETTKKATTTAIRRPRCSRRRSAGLADETPQKQSWFFDTVVSSDPAKRAAPQRTSRRAKRAIRHSERRKRSNQIRTAGLCGLETSIEDFGLRLSSAPATWAFSSESVALPQVTFGPDCKVNTMLSRPFALIRSTFLRSLSGSAAATVATSRRSGASVGLTSASTTSGGSVACV
jgi:hypothetical protein